ncbi:MULTISPECIES: EAL domain-containing protein [unclassified Rhodanobacter]|uniref:bifunctional diguanylate cyclase/phosphodiesterase n=1 Tax=unclassified Rhodanobacter TaxID=2621553 RepID=UPI0020331B52|nr:MULTISPECIES: EAL domain-containing protein [unclassified Rhodanobacter]
MPSSWRLTAWLWSLLALLAGLALALAVHHQQKQRQEAERTFLRDELANKTYAGLQSKLHSAESLLRAVQTLFLASDEVTASEFNSFYTNLHPREQFPSLLALAYAQREPGPDGVRYVTRWVEPMAGNEAVVGLDVGAQPNNLAGLLASRDSDRATLSAPFRPVQQPAIAGAADGITLRLPVFSPGNPPQSVGERRQRMRGSIAVSFRVGRLIGNALPDEAAHELRLRLSDVTDARHVLPLFDSDPGVATATDGYRFERRLAYGGRVWNVLMQPRDSRALAIDWRRSTLPAGLLASLLLALLVYSIVSTRQRALELGWRMSRRFRESEERFRALNELLPALVLLAEVDGGQITYANQASRDRLGEHVTERQLADLFEDQDLRTQLQDADTRGCSRIEAALHNGEGVRFWASVAISRVLLSGRGKLLMVAGDISEQRQLTELLSHQASHDALTELYNRREFEHRLHGALTATTIGTPPAVLLYIDLDQFKLINDTSGHLAGDQLLAQLAIVMRKQLGGTDMLARLGGDEFGVLVTGVADREEAERIAERVRCCIDGYVFLWEQRSYTISASIGGVMIDRPGILVKDLLAQADTACYMAKELGRNRVHFYSERDDETVRRHSEMEWANRLRWAVDEHRLVLTYQEIWPLPLAAGGDTDIEMLLRFREESGQLVVPGVFMPAAERYGLMPVVDRWVIETTLANFAQLHPAGGVLRMVAINLSGASVEDEELAGLIIGLLRRYRVEPSRVCFEVTETVAVRNLSQVVRFMEQLRAVGCRIALDDFGAGMSSFTYLKNLPLDIIKIDGSFVRDMLTDPVSHLMVRAVTDIGHRLGLEVVAEWVADAETVQALAALGVNRVQGFSLHRPELALFQRD